MTTHVTEIFAESLFKYYPAESEGKDADICGFYFENKIEGDSAYQYLEMNTDEGMYRCVFEILNNDKLSITFRKMDNTNVISLDNIITTADSIKNIKRKVKKTSYYSVALVHFVSTDEKKYYHDEEKTVISIKSIELLD